MTTRRDILKGAGSLAAAAVAGIPALAEGAPIAVVAIQAELPKVAWGVGILDYGSEIIFAETSEDAARIFASQQGYERCEDGERAGEHCGNDDCDDCRHHASIETERHKSMDRFCGRSHEITNIDYHRIGWCVPCQECNDQHAYNDHTEYPMPWDVQAVDGVVLCDECARIREAEMTAAFGPLLDRVDA